MLVPADASAAVERLRRSGVDLAPGQNAPLPEPAVTVTSGPGPDLTALVLSADGKVASDADMVFFNQPTAPGVELTGQQLRVQLGALRPGAEKVLLVASGTTATTATVQSGASSVTFTPQGLTTETAVVLVELYRRGADWKVRAVGQGYADGLAGLARDVGVDVTDDGGAPPPPGQQSARQPAVRFTKGEDELPVDMRTRLNLRKEKVAVELEKHRLTGLQCRVVVVLDTSGSTSGLYRKGVFSRAVERVAPVAAQVDDGAEMQAWAMGSSGVRLADITIGGLPGWLERYTAQRFRDAGGVNNEKAVIAEVLAYVRAEPLPIPTLVLFFHDGGVTDDRGTEQAVRGAAGDPVFWQFVGIGRSNYGVLERLDTLSGREHDNTGFFALDDLDAVSDEDLYARLLGEFPDWVRSYYPDPRQILR